MRSWRSMLRTTLPRPHPPQEPLTLRAPLATSTRQCRLGSCCSSWASGSSTSVWRCMCVRTLASGSLSINTWAHIAFFPSLSCNSHLCMLLKHEKISKLFDCIIIIIISQMSTQSRSSTFVPESCFVFNFFFSFLKESGSLMIQLNLLH